VTDKLPISVCILCKNEEDRLRACLEVLEPFKEVLVMDTGSADSSVGLAQSYEYVTLIEESWQGFALSRRSLFNKATQPWIFWLDADEVLSGELIAELKRLMVKDLKNEAYEINRMVFFEDQWIKHGLWFPDWNVRLFKQGCWDMPEREVHESLEITGQIDRLQGLIYHYTYRDWADQRQRSIKYATLWAKQKKKEGKESSLGKAVVRSSWAFMRSYFLKKGCLDGYLGFKIAIAVSKEVYLKHSLLFQMRKSEGGASH